MCHRCLMLINMFILDQHEKFPKGKEVKGVGETRGHVKLTSFVDLQGTRTSEDNHNIKRKFDLEAFIVHMYNCRRWSGDKAKTTFNKYKNDVAYMNESKNKTSKGRQTSRLESGFLDG